MKHGNIFFTALLLALIVPAQAQNASEIKSLYCVMVTEMQQGGFAQKLDMELWVEGENFRTEVPLFGFKQISIKSGDTLYNYQQGSLQGTKMKLDGALLPAQQDPLRQLRNIQRPEQKVGEETVDGVVCDKYETIAQGVPVTTWVSKATQFPHKMITAAPQGAVTIFFRNVEINKGVDAAKFIPPADVVFTDTTERLRQFQQQQPQ